MAPTPPPASDSLPGGALRFNDPVGTVIAERYRVLEHLSDGGMATVYLAEHVAVGRQLAIKILHPEQAVQPDVVRRFLQEARAASLVRNPHVVDIIDVGFTGEGLAYMAMELIEGEDLATLLARVGPLPWSRLAPMVLQICDALAATHARGIVHRDIKPENCVVTEFNGAQDFVKLIDFGIAKDLAGNLDNDRPRTISGSIYGTAAYVAPELLSGKVADHRVDIYALGILMYELLLGERPFAGEALSDILVGHLQQAPVPLRTRIPLKVTDAVDALILRCLEKDPGKRFQSMAELGEAIADTIDYETLKVSIETGAVPTGSYLSALRRDGSRAHRSVPPPRPRRRLLLAGAAALLALTVTLLAWLLFPAAPAPVSAGPVAALAVLAEPDPATRLPLSIAPPAAPSRPATIDPEPPTLAPPGETAKPIRLTVAAVRKEIDRKIAPKARACLAKHTRLIKGQHFPVHVEIEASGDATATATLATSPAARCIADLFRRHQFPANIGGLTLDHAFTP